MLLNRRLAVWILTLLTFLNFYCHMWVVFFFLFVLLSFFSVVFLSDVSLKIDKTPSLYLSLSQDAQIEKEKQVCNITGGCTALTVVYLLGKLYVGNAGDSRCVCSVCNKYVLSEALACTPSLLYSLSQEEWKVACILLFQCSVCVCRAIIIRNNEIIPMSTEFTPESERQRLQFLVRKSA